MSPTLNLCQQAYVLSYESNALTDSTGNTQTGSPDKLAKSLQDHLTTFLGRPETCSAMGQWSLVWGPVVYESIPGLVADNVMYVAANADQSVYVVAIAGTGGGSLVDLLIEDNSVSTAIPWKAAFPSLKGCDAPAGLNPHISLGTQVGVNILLGMVDKLRTQMSLVDFLGSLSATGSKTLIFSGHSLGGALSPTLALSLFTPVGGKFSTANWGHVYVLPTAGATPGDAGFSTFFGQVFPAASLGGSKDYYVWNQNIWNSIDVVPHAYSLDSLLLIPYLYPSPWNVIPPQAPPQELSKQVNGAIGSSLLFGVNALSPFTRIPNKMVPGTFFTSDKIPPVTDYDSFFAQLGYQHTVAYENFFGVTDLVSDKARSGLSRTAAGLMASHQRMGEKKERRAAVENMVQHLNQGSASVGGVAR